MGVPAGPGRLRGSQTDVVVAGLGVLGAAAAAALARRGLAVVGLDRHRPPHRLGSSHGGTRIIRRVYPEGSLYVPLAERAYRQWRRLERRTGSSLLVTSGGLYLGAPRGPLISAARDCAERLGLEHELLDAVGVCRRVPLLEPPDDVAALWDPAAGVLRAERCHRALLAEAAAAGAELRFDCPLERWSCSAEAVRVDSGAGRLDARWLVLATGAWLADDPDVAAHLTVERQVQHWFEPATAAGPEALPPFVWELPRRRTWYGLPDLGAGVKAAFHHGGERATAETVRREVSGEERDAVRRLLGRYLPAVAGPPTGSAVCLYTNTPDRRFLAGPLPGRPRLWLLGGGSGHGFKFAPALGELLAEGLAEGRPPAELAPFLPARLDQAQPAPGPPRPG